MSINFKIAREVPFFEFCDECGSKFELITKSGRKREIIKNVFVEIPGDFEIPTCLGCGDEIWSPEMSEELDPYLLEIVKKENL